MILVCNKDETTLKKTNTLNQDDIWWDTYYCPTCKTKYKTCYNHWGLIKC